MRRLLAVLSFMLIDLSGAAFAAEGCHPKIDLRVPQYIVAYGSLMEKLRRPVRRQIPGPICRSW